MKRIARLSALCLIAVGSVFCAPPDTGDGSPNLQIQLSGIWTGTTSQIQLSVLRGAQTLLSQPDVDKRCIREVAAAAGTEFLLLRKSDNEPRTRAVAFDVATERVTLSGIEPGSDYLFVGEAISRKDPPTLLASGRVRYDRFEAKDNPPRNMEISGTADGGDLAGCDPTISNR